MSRKKESTGTSHWMVKFTRRGMEPPMPFGKTKAVVCASSREAAKEMVPASPGYPCTASATTDKVTWPNRCHCEEKSDSQLEAEIASALPKTPAQLEAEIAEALGNKSGTYTPKYGNESDDFERGLKDGTESARHETRREARESLGKLRQGARTEYDRGMVIGYAKALGEA